MHLLRLSIRDTSFTRRLRQADHAPLSDTLVLVRWAAIAALFALTVAAPVPGWAGLPGWALILVYAAYNAVADLLVCRGVIAARARLAGVDLVLIGCLFLLGQDDDGPLYALFILAVIGAAATLSTWGLLLSGAIVILVDVAAEMSLRATAPMNQIIEHIATRAVVLGFIAIGTIRFLERLATEQANTRLARDEAAHAAELDRLRGNVVAAVTHDLQTPLTALRAGLGLLEASVHDRLRRDEAQLLTNARRNVDRLGWQINDFVSLNQLEADEFQVNLAPLDLRAIVASVVATAHPLLTQKGQKLDVEVDQPLLVEADRRRLEQAVLNLVVNAHQHTPPGTRITIRARATDAGMLLQIVDDGPGIPRHLQGRIFDRFVRADDQTSGSGLGLTIAKAVIERHQGRLWVESIAGQGATFSLLLPPAHEETSYVVAPADRG